MASCVPFSGGIDSTFLTKELLNDGETVLAVYVKTGWGDFNKPRLHYQNQSVRKLAEFFKEKYPNQFTYVETGVEINVPIFHGEPWAKDTQWSFFLAAQIVADYNYANPTIDKMWYSLFTYNILDNLTVKKHMDPTFLTDELIPYLKMAHHWPNVTKHPDAGLPKIMIPCRLNCLKGYDRFMTVQNAFDTLDPYLQKYVRSCFGGEWFCGKCSKCKVWKYSGVSNKNPFNDGES